MVNEIAESISGDIKEQTDIIFAIKEIFKKDSIDVRTRLTYKGLRAHAVVNYLKNIMLKEEKNSCVISGIEVFSRHIKTMLISLDGKSRDEMVRIFQNDLQNKQNQSGGFNFFTPQTK